MNTMSFQPLIVVILLVFLVLMALAMFLWFLISPGDAVSPVANKAKTVKAVKPAKKSAAPRPNPALRERVEPIRQTAAIQPKKLKAKEKPELKQNKKPDLKYIEVRPEPARRNKLAKKTKSKPLVDDTATNKLENTAQSRDNFRGLNASKVEKPKKMDPFDSFVEASKRLD